MKHLSLFLLLFLVGCGVGSDPVTSTAPAISVQCKSSIGSPNVFAFDGDSLTVGYAGYQPIKPWTDNVVVPDGFVKYNVGLGGWQITDMASHAASELDPKLNPQAKWNVLWVMGGTNDQSHVDEPTTMKRLRSFATERRSRGWNVIVVTLPSRVRGDRFKNQFNADLRGHWQEFADGVADIGAIPQIGSDGAYRNPQYFLRDGYHLTDAGYAYFSATAADALKQLLSKCGS